MKKIDKGLMEALKTSAIIIFFIALAAAIMTAIYYNLPTGIVVFFAGFVCSLLIYAAGEIVNQLQKLNDSSKSKK